MPKEPDFDLVDAHRFFSGRCFNQAWEFIDKQDRSPAETDDMIQAAHASAWHWRQRPDCVDDRLSVSYWQLSRVYALADESRLASRYADLCLEVSRDRTPFLIGYAYEAQARAAATAGDSDAARKHLDKAKECLSQIADSEERVSREGYRFHFIVNGGVASYPKAGPDRGNDNDKAAQELLR